MTGAKHYEAAELVLDDLDEEMASARADELDAETLQTFLMRAQVHATLALAAATALAGPTSGRLDTMAQWVSVAG